MVTVNGNLDDWPPSARLDDAATGTPGYAFYGTRELGVFYFALVADDVTIGAGTTIWLDTDLNRASGYQIWGFTGGVEYHIEIAADGSAALYAGGPGGSFITSLDAARSADGRVLEIAVAAADLGNPPAVRVFADVNDQAHLPNSYNDVDFFVGQMPVTHGAVTLDGTLDDWAPSTRLDDAATGTPGYALYGDLQDGHYLFAIAADDVTIGEGTTIWLDTDLNRASGYQIWGFTGGVEYHIEIAADGSAALYAGGPGGSFITSLDAARSADGRVLEIAVAAADLGNPPAVRVFADVNDQAFLPNSYNDVDFFVGQMPVTHGAVTLDGTLDDWAPSTRLDDAATGTPGYALYGDLQDGHYLFAITAEEVTIGEGTTIWLDTDLNRASGYQIWGFTGGVEYHIEIAANGRAMLYSGAPGWKPVAILESARSADGRVLEIAVAAADLGDPPAVRVFADVNDQAFLPNSYNDVDFFVGTPPPVQQPDDPSYRIGIVYSETSAQNFYDLTAYGQLFMSAQAQAMQAGIPFDLLTEDDLKDAAALAGYDALVFPAFANVPTADVAAITEALATASASYGVSLIAAGNFMTNDENGAVLAGDPFARMQALLGVTFAGWGTTDGIDLTAGSGPNPVLAGYDAGELVGAYTDTGYVSFADVTGSGEVLFNQTVSQGGTSATVAGVIATENGARNVHFASDAIIGNSNILHAALDWVTQDDNPGVSLSLTRHDMLFYARNDMDQSQRSIDVVGEPLGIYDEMLPIVQDWYDRYGFTGSYYVNIGAYPPGDTTDWSVSRPYYDALIALEGEIGSHSWTHPLYTDLLLPDTITDAILADRIADYAALVNQGVPVWSPYGMRGDSADPAVLAALAQMDAADINAMLADLLARTDPNDPAAVDPAALTEVERAVLEASFRFQFEYSKLVIEQNMGIALSGAAVPGAPETVETSREIMAFYDYLSGGYSGIGAGYPNAYGYLTPGDADAVYLAPNMAFDFTLLEYRGMSATEAQAYWANEFATLTAHATTPVLIFPWHDYGPTNWFSTGYTVELFEAVIANAAANGAEFVTGEDLAGRIKSFSESSLTLRQSGNVITAEVSISNAGNMALDVSESGRIASVADWYAYSDSKVFLPANGGSFQITLGDAQADVTHITALPMRGELLTVSGNGRDLDFSFAGRGRVDVALANQQTSAILITGTDGGEIGAGAVRLDFDSIDQHAVAIRYAPGGLIAGTTANDVLIGGSLADTLAAGAGDDLLQGGGEADSFVFSEGFGADVVTDFATGSDLLDLTALAFQSAAEALAAFVQTADGLLLAYSDEDRLLLAGLGSGGLAEADILAGQGLLA